MKPQFKKSLFIFRRDLRLEDNTGLIYALQNSEQVIPAFIFTPEQIDDNPLRNDHCIQFMLESLEDLEGQLAKKGGVLRLFYGTPDEIVEKCIKNLNIDAVIVNKDYTPYSIRRDKEIENKCRKHRIPFLQFDDALLHDPEQILKNDGKPYTVFSAYFKKAFSAEVLPPKRNPYSNFCREPISFAENESIYRSILPKKNTHLAMHGGRAEAMKILTHIGSLSAYGTTRNLPALNGTSHLSPYLKFTVCSPREVYYAIKEKLGVHHELIRELFWRDFFTSIAYFFPYVFEGPFKAKYSHIKWSTDKKSFTAWCEGKTGFPIVDAGMREMNQTGYMHNRVRMVVASFLTKDLHIDWRWGEKYFAKTLIDYDPAVNNGNWQWAASTGCDAQPYFRIFNPWTQQKKFDPQCEYIKRWIPELRNLNSEAIQNWEKLKLHHLAPTYPSPIVDHSLQAKGAIQLYKRDLFGIKFSGTKN